MTLGFHCDVIRTVPTYSLSIRFKSPRSGLEQRRRSISATSAVIRHLGDAQRDVTF